MLKHTTILVQGIVQGVGFRPFITVLAKSLNITGTVLNLGNAGVRIEAEGDEEIIKEFIRRINAEKPSICGIDSMDIRWTDMIIHYPNFSILSSIDEKA